MSATSDDDDNSYDNDPDDPCLVTSHPSGYEDCRLDELRRCWSCGDTIVIEVRGDCCNRCHKAWFCEGCLQNGNDCRFGCCCPWNLRAGQATLCEPAGEFDDECGNMSLICAGCEDAELPAYPPAAAKKKRKSLSAAQIDSPLKRRPSNRTTSVMSQSPASSSSSSSSSSTRPDPVQARVRMMDTVRLHAPKDMAAERVEIARALCDQVWESAVQCQDILGDVEFPYDMGYALNALRALQQAADDFQRAMYYRQQQ